MTDVILSTTFFGPIQWYQKINRYDNVAIDCSERFLKQTYRNRCIIATTNGLQALTVPVEHSYMQMVRDIRISDHNNWRHQHWYALKSAYSESPFYEYYADDIRPFFERKWDFLYDYNQAIVEKMCELLQIDMTAVSGITDSDMPASRDFRNIIQPKHPGEDPEFESRPYYQVFQRKHGFLPNLSILDLLFNMGPEGIFYL